MNTLPLLADACFAVCFFGLALNAKDRLWRGVGFVLAALNLAFMLAHLYRWT
jgi:hypothetical protein